MMGADSTFVEIAGSGPAAMPQARPSRRERSWFARLFPGKDTSAAGPRLPLRTIAIEWAIIAVIVFAFCATFLTFDDTRALPGIEHELVQTLDWTLVNSLHQFGQFPLWNPYIRTGFPYVADPFLHVYNPLVTLPVLTLGVWNGFRVALFLSFLAAALGCWWLGAVLGVGGLARVWMALMYAFTGQGVARFIQGEYDFVLGFAWIPCAIAFVLLAMRTRRPIHIVGAVVTLALIFFSGNVYYAFHTATVMVLLAAVSLVGLDRRDGRWRPRLRSDRLLVLVVIGVLVLGFTAVQWMPLAEFGRHFTKISDPLLTGSHNLHQIWLDYVSKDLQRLDLDVLRYSPREEFYAYTGIWPFLMLLALPLAVRRTDKHALVFLGALLLFSLAWIATRYMPWAGLFSSIKFLTQFKHQTRMLIFGGVALLGLAGLGLDALWQRVKAMLPLRRMSLPEVLRWLAARLGAALLVIFCIASVADLMATNRAFTRTSDFYAPPYELMDWLRRSDDSTFLVGSPHLWNGAVISNGVRYVDAYYGLDLIMPAEGAINRRAVRAQPNYLAQGNDLAVQQPDAQLVKQFPGHSIYRLPNSLPYAFVVAETTLSEPAGGQELRAADVRAVEPALASPNRIEIAADAAAGDVLTVLATNLPGWRAAVDGRSQPLVNVGGYLGVRATPGRHTYTFSYHPSSFSLGLAISILTLFGLVGLVLTEVRLARPRRKRFKLDAIYADGVLHPAEPLALPENAAVRLTVEEKPAPRAVPVRSEGELLRRSARLAWILFWLSLAVYVVTRLWGITRFPIYFFTDEAANPLFAQDLIENGFKNAQGVSFPLYFELAANRMGPLLSVYIHMITSVLFGKSVLVTRATQALMSVLAALSIAFSLKLVFKARFWWAGVLLLAMAPTWFLHSRTGFETVIAASFYGCFLLFYLLYRTRSPRYIFPAIVFGAATFYTYSNGQMIMAAAGLLLGVTDIRYHLKHWRTNVFAVALIAVAAIPALRFRMSDSEAFTKHLRVLDSYWFRDIPLKAKMLQFARTYAYGLSPNYWFIPNEHDLARHRMLGYGNLNWYLLPFFLLGVGVSLWRTIKGSAPHRILLLATIATSAGAALADIALTRVMAFVVPATILIAVGIEFVLDLVRQWLSERGLAIALFGLLTIPSLLMTRDALVNGPLWYRDYGLYGMQYGATQLFGEAIPAYLSAHPEGRLVVSPTWANGTDNFIRFFLTQDQQQRVSMANVDYFMKEQRPLEQNMVLVMTPLEYEQARSSGKFKQIEIAQALPYPDGSPGFYFVHLAYADNLAEIVAQEKAARSKPVTESIEIDGQMVQVSHSIFDGGQLRDLFDGDAFTLARGLEANPLIVELAFPQPRPLKGLTADFGSMDFTLTAKLYPEGSEEPVVYSEAYRGLPPDPHVELAFDKGPAAVSRLRLEILQLNAGDEAHVHVRELKLR